MKDIKRIFINKILYLLMPNKRVKVPSEIFEYLPVALLTIKDMREHWNFNPNSGHVAACTCVDCEAGPVENDMLCVTEFLIPLLVKIMLQQ